MWLTGTGPRQSGAASLIVSDNPWEVLVTRAWGVEWHIRLDIMNCCDLINLLEYAVQTFTVKNFHMQQKRKVSMTMCRSQL